MYKRILLAYNEKSHMALAECIALAKNQKAHVRIVYVIDEVHSLMGMEYVDLESLKKERIKQGKSLLSRAKQHAEKAGLQVDTALLEPSGESVSEKINEEAETWEADLIVVGTKGSKGIKRFLLGSVSEGVIRSASGNSSILLVKEPQEG